MSLVFLIDSKEGGSTIWQCIYKFIIHIINGAYYKVKLIKKFSDFDESFCWKELMFIAVP